jgi:hypothetical protein
MGKVRLTTTWCEEWRVGNVPPSRIAWLWSCRQQRDWIAGSLRLLPCRATESVGGCAPHFRREHRSCRRRNASDKCRRSSSFAHYWGAHGMLSRRLPPGRWISRSIGRGLSACVDSLKLRAERVAARPQRSDSGRGEASLQEPCPHHFGHAVVEAPESNRDGCVSPKCTAEGIVDERRQSADH